MKIKKVIYELFESDYSSIKGNEHAEIHEIDRELCLDLEGGKCIYISWSSKPEQYSVGYKESSWNEDEPFIKLDASGWKMWKPIIRQECELIFHNQANQILELKGKTASVYFSSQKQGGWFVDVLHISSKKPEMNS